MFCHFTSKIRVCGNRCHTLSFKDEDNRKMPVDAEKNKLQNCYLGFLKVWKFWKFWDFFQHFFSIFFKKSPKFQNFQKTGKYVLEETLKNVCTKFQVIPFINAVFIALLNVKNGYFSGHLGVIPCISIFSFYSDFYATNDVLRSFFRVLDEKPTHEHVLGRQMTEIGNLTSWPQMTLTSEKVISG